MVQSFPAKVVVVVVVVVVGLFHVYLKHGYFYNDISIEMRFIWMKMHVIEYGPVFYFFFKMAVIL